MFAQDRTWSPNSMARKYQTRTRTRKPTNSTPNAPPAPNATDPTPTPPRPDSAEPLPRQPSRDLPVTPEIPAPAAEPKARDIDGSDRPASFAYPSIPLGRRGSSDTSSADRPSLTTRRSLRLDHGRSASHSSISSVASPRRPGGTTRPVDIARAARSRALGSIDTPTPEPGASQSDDSSRSNASRHSRRGAGTRATRIMTSIEEEEYDEPSAGQACDFCGSDLAGSMTHKCRDCPFRLCHICIDNVGVTHPGHSSTHRCKVSSAPSTERGTGSPEKVDDTEGWAGRIICDVCEQELVHVRYECQECPDTNLCEEHRDWHITGHVLRPIHRHGAERKGRPRGQTGAQAPIQDNTRHRARIRRDTATQSHDEEGAAGLDDEDGRDMSSDDHVWDNSGDDDDDGDDYGSGNIASRRGASRPGGSRPGPSHITLTLPIDGEFSIRSLAEAILAQIPESQSGHRTSATNPRGRRLWRPGDKQRLHKLKTEGRTNREIAAIMGRTTSAVSQQWRKQG